MRSLNRKIDQFCYKHPRFGVPRLMLYIILGNVIVYLFSFMNTTGWSLYDLLCFDPEAFCHGQVWRLATFAIVPTTNGILWLAISLYFYYFIGSSLENAWGAGKFTIYYFSGLLILALYSVLVYLIFGLSVVVTAHYLNLSLFFAFATLWPEQRVLLFFFIPMKIKWLAWIDAAFFAYEVVATLAGQGAYGLLPLAVRLPFALVPVVAMLTYLLFCGDWLFDFFRPSHARQKARTIQFRQAVKKVQREQAAAPYQYRCSVCGRTDVSDPQLEFRYCSRCQGYHCFCQDHINNHIHFQE